MRIEPKSRLAEPTPPCPKVELFVESGSAEEFLSKVKKSWPEEVLYDYLIFSKSMNRTVFMWQVASLSAAQFETLKGEAQQELERRAEKQSTADKSQPPAKDETFELSEWGVVMRPADPDLLAKKGVLRGAVIEKVSDEPTVTGLQAGDLIIDYEKVYDLVMGHRSTLEKFWKHKAKWGGKLHVLRGERIVTLDVKGQKD